MGKLAKGFVQWVHAMNEAEQAEGQAGHIAKNLETRIGSSFDSMSQGWTEGSATWDMSDQHAANILNAFGFSKRLASQEPNPK